MLYNDTTFKMSGSDVTTLCPMIGLQSHACDCKYMLYKIHCCTDRCNVAIIHTYIQTVYHTQCIWYSIQIDCNTVSYSNLFLAFHLLLCCTVVQYCTVYQKQFDGLNVIALMSHTFTSMTVLMCLCTFFQNPRLLAILVSGSTTRV